MSTEPYAIPVTAPIRAGDNRILISLAHGRNSLARLRKNPRVALTILSEGNCAFSARGRARIVQEPMEDSPGFVAVEIDVDEINDQRLPGFAVISGIGLQLDGEGERNLRERVEDLQKISCPSKR